MSFVSLGVSGGVFALSCIRRTDLLVDMVWFGWEAGHLQGQFLRHLGWKGFPFSSGCKKLTPSTKGSSHSSGQDEMLYQHYQVN